MSRLFLTSLGLGAFDRVEQRYKYEPAVYRFEGTERKSRKTSFVQVAELELLGTRFDQVVVVVTAQSQEQQYPALENELRELGIEDPLVVAIGDDKSARGQWEWFEKVLGIVEPNSSLTVDLTHGWRAVPVVLSAAINFLTKARNIVLEGAYYGLYDRNQEVQTIIDMREFYTINSWADAVARLVDDADSSLLAAVARESPSFQSRGLASPETVGALERVTRALRNVEVNRVAKEAHEALTHLRDAVNDTGPTGRLLLEMVVERFTGLAEGGPPSGLYDADYFLTQLEIARILLEHGLHMQGFTVMRELVGSLGMVGLPGVRYTNSTGRGRRAYAEVFVNMVQFDREKWSFEEHQAKIVEKLLPHYELLDGAQVVAQLRAFIKKLLEYRNGFDHAWTSKAAVPDGLEQDAKCILGELRRAVLEANAVMSSDSVRQQDVGATGTST